MVEIYTAQIGRYTGSDAIDVSKQSRHPLGRVFAPPSWGMLMSVKRGLITSRTFANYYLSFLRETRGSNFAAWQRILERARVVLTCLCPPQGACHRTLLAKALAMEGGRYRGELALHDPNFSLDFARSAPEAA